MKSKLGDRALQWHHRLAQITGGLALRIAKRNLVPSEVQGWADECASVGADMNTWINEDLNA